MNRYTLNLARALPLIAVFCDAPVMAAPDSAKTPTTMTQPGAAASVGRTFIGSTTVRCPPSITVQATNAPSPWQPNGVVLNVQSAVLSDQPPPTQQMMCRYSGNGYSWATGRNIQPEFKTCSPSGTSFVCSKP